MSPGALGQVSSIARVSGAAALKCPDSLENLVQLGMLLRMICRTVSSSAVRSVSALKAAPARFDRSGAVGVRRHAAALVSRTLWQGPPTTLLSLRSFRTSAATKSVLADLLQEELDHENKTYEPPEVGSTFGTGLCGVYAAPDSKSSAIICRRFRVVLREIGN